MPTRRSVTYSLHQHASSGHWILAEVLPDGTPQPLPDSYPSRAAAVGALQAQAALDRRAGITVRVLHREGERNPLEEAGAAPDAPWIVVEGDEEMPFVSFRAAKRESLRRGLDRAQIRHRDYGPVPSIRMGSGAVERWLAEQRGEEPPPKRAGHVCARDDCPCPIGQARRGERGKAGVVMSIRVPEDVAERLRGSGNVSQWVTEAVRRDAGEAD